MAGKKTSDEPTVIEPDGEQGIQTRLVVMSRAKPDDGAASTERPQEANIQWVFKPMTPRRRGSKVPPSIGSMPIPGKP